MEYAVPFSYSFRSRTNGYQPVAKRQIALLRSLKQLPEAVAALNKFLEASPTDAEAWSELADIYLSQGLFQQSIFALEEVLLIAPNAWNVCYPLPNDFRVALTTTDASSLGRDTLYGWYDWRPSTC